MSSADRFLERWSRALRLEWSAPPAAARRRARRLPAEDPVPPLPPGAPARRLRPRDVRAAAAAETDGAMISRSLPGVDVTLLVTPPEGDALWRLRGRAWLRDGSGGPIGIALVQDQNVLGEVTIESGGSFELRDILVGAWSLELHLPDGRAAVLRGTSG